MDVQRRTQTRLRFQGTVPDLIHEEHVRHEAEVEAVRSLLAEEQYETRRIGSKPF